MTTEVFEDQDLPPNVWVDIHAALGLATGTPLIYQNNGGVTFRAVTAVSEPAETNNKFGVNVPTGSLLFEAKPMSTESLWLRGVSGSKIGKVGILPPSITPMQTSGPPLSFDLQLAQGFIPGKSSLEKFGHNPSIAAGATADIWNGGGLYTGFPTAAAETVSISSASLNDTAAGSGLRTLRLFGQLAGVPQTEDIILNGQTDVVSVKLWDRLFRVRGLTSGGAPLNSAFNDGDITIHHTTTTGNVFAVVPAGTNRSQICATTIEAGKTAYLKEFNPWISRANGQLGSTDVAVMFREPGGVWEQLFTSGISTANSPPIEIHYTQSFPELTDIVARIINPSDNGTIASCSMFFGLVDD